MTSDLRLIEMTDGAGVNFGGLHGAKGLFHVFQIFIAVSKVFRLEFLLRDIGERMT